MGWRWLWIIGLFVWASGITAQTAPDYAISNPDANIANDSTVRVSFIVTNLGSDAEALATAFVALRDSDTRLGEQAVLPLQRGGSSTVTIGAIDLGELATDVEQQLVLTIEFDDDASIDADLSNNQTDLFVTVPTAPDATAFFAYSDNIFTLAGRDYPGEQVALVLGIGLIVFLFIWLLTVLVRTIFRRPPRFGTWQPPYSMMPFDQSTIEGRRQAWQQFAQHSLLLAPPIEGNIAAIKLLLGRNGEMLKNWKVTGLRLSQYDQYGRIARSEYVAQRKWVRRLNKTVQRSSTLSQEALYRQLRPLARGLVGQFKRRIVKKHTILPIALDVRFQGEHGDVRILFELYQCRNNLWYRLDQWEPQMGTMGPISQKLIENFTYTIHGRNSVETPRDFYRRLQDDLVWLLFETLRTYEAAQQAPEQAPQPRQTYDVPDTLAGVDPITDSMQQTG